MRSLTAAHYSTEGAQQIRYSCAGRPRDAAVALARRAGLGDVIARHVKLRRQGREYVGLCPFHDERTPSFTVSEDKGFYHCFGCGAHGDAIDFVMQFEGVSFRAAVGRLSDTACGTQAGTSVIGGVRLRAKVPLDPARVDVDAEARMRRACEIWRTSRRITPRELAHKYLIARGLRPGAWGGNSAWPPTLRCRRLRYAEPDGPLCGSIWHTMIGAVQRFYTARGAWALTGVHRTYISRDRAGKAPVRSPKKLLGSARGGAIRLAPGGARLGLAEGIETALSVMQAVPGLPVWAAGSLGNLGGVALPPDVREVILLMDDDTADRNGLKRALDRARATYAGRGLKVRVAWPRPGCDFNDVLQGEAA